MNGEYREAGYLEVAGELPPVEPPIGEEIPWWERYGPWILGGTALVFGIIALSKK